MSRRHYGQSAPQEFSFSDLSRVFVQLPEAPDERYFHDDLVELSDDELRRERVLLRMALHLRPRPDWWLKERLLRIAQEEGRRRGC